MAWINWQEDVSALNLKSGGITVTGLDATVYKYVYPTYGGTSDVINYQGEGTVTSSAIGSVGTNFKMNRFDPTYLKITSGSTISKLNTNLVLKVTFSFLSSVPVDIVFSVVRKNAYENTNPMKVSYYLHYQSLDSASFSALDASAYADDASKVFFPMKTYAEGHATNDVKFGENASLDVFSASMDGKEDNSAQTVTFYLNIDYDDTLTKAVFYDVAHLGNQYTLSMDYSFLLTVKESEE